MMPQTDAASSRLLRLINGYQFTQALYVAAKLGIADLLRNGPMHVDELASATSTHAASLYRLLRGLSGYGIFAERPGRVFDLSPLAGCLQEDSPWSVKDTALVRGDDYYRTWGELLFSIQTGKPSFNRVFGMSNWEYRQAHPEANARFNSFASEMARQRAEAVIAAYNFAGEVIVDVGGGNGTLLTSILQRYPGLKGVVFDTPHVIEDARTALRAPAEVRDRCKFVAGDFFKEVPVGGTLYMLSAVLHDWDDTDAAAILRNCRAAMTEHATLLIIERVLPPTNEPSPVFLADLDMLVNTGGCERDEASWRALLNATGLRLTSMLATNGGFYILRANARIEDGVL